MWEGWAAHGVCVGNERRAVVVLGRALNRTTKCSGSSTVVDQTSAPSASVAQASGTALETSHSPREL